MEGNGRVMHQAAGKPRFGVKMTHFVKWDNKKPGGRWFECSISAASDTEYNV